MPRPRRYVVLRSSDERLPYTAKAILIITLISSQNIAKAQKEIDRLEADEEVTDTARKPAEKNQAVNGGPVSAAAELQQEKAAEADVAEELEKAKIEDSEAPES
jgi:hypothetical protein